ncbi:acyl-CoA dehydrogenase NM domain-like protein [Rhizoclosmatium globosum]|uniref:Acyl-CoA dehydrogenase NM domain-like protein n=1 Tax=Rhizoclosmatium globosum TaxID=329046 RepID=A0A1Y2BY87_9FUNG|nr:acyl-CoA dehydrogenase NM domain-like protein [Rhizoclosmatium globosum]|eukprot:ORY39607.1 acyl-CoA dehydrogenase NM domain-like protein [Rhizoclosmatium globosum]
MSHIRRAAQFNDPHIVRAMAECCDSFGMRIGVHEILFKSTIATFGSSAQKSEWLPKIDQFKVLGSFAMTELGHSSSLRDLETTATFDDSTDQFVLNSPTLTSTKWWIGMVGQVATHTCILAQTIVKGENIGLNWFLLQLRDIDTGKLQPGVVCGACGPKAGRNAEQRADSKRDMLMRMCDVNKEGEVTGPIHPALMYATLIPERLALTFAAKASVGKALAITFHHQSEQPQAKTMHTFKLVNMLSTLVVIYVAERQIMSTWNKFQSLGANDPSSKQYLSQLPDIHASAAVEGICSRRNYTHKPSFESITRLIGDWGVMTTGGGDNYALVEQCARYLMAHINKAFESPSHKFKGSVEYLSRAKLILDAHPVLDSERVMESCMELRKRKCRVTFGLVAHVNLSQRSMLHVQLYLLYNYKSALESSPPPLPLHTLLIALQESVLKPKDLRPPKCIVESLGFQICPIARKKVSLEAHSMISS